MQNDSVPNAARAPQGLRTVTGDPDRGNAGIRPGHLDRMAVIGDLLSGGEIANHTNRFLEVFQGCRLLPHDTARTIAPSDPTIHSSAGNPVERGEQAGGHSGITNHGVGNAGPEPHAA